MGLSHHPTPIFPSQHKERPVSLIGHPLCLLRKAVVGLSFLCIGLSFSYLAKLGAISKVSASVLHFASSHESQRLAIIIFSTREVFEKASIKTT